MWPSPQLMDDALVAARDTAANFLLARASVGHNRAASSQAAAHELNPRVHVDVEACGVADKQAKWFGAFRVIVSCNRTPAENVALNAHSRVHGAVFVATGTHGHVGYLFSDAHGHRYLADETRKDGAAAATHARDTPHVVAQTRLFGELLSDTLDWARLTANARRRVPSMVFALLVLWTWQQRHSGQLPTTADSVAMRALRDELSARRAGGASGALIVSDVDLDRLVCSVRGEFAPVCAIAGGVVGQHVIRVLTAKGKPLDNFFIFDSPTHAGKVEVL